jgi:hypothetical protein
MGNGMKGNMVMKYAYTLAMAAAAFWLAGCASAPPVVQVDAVGPAPSMGAAAAGDGSLVVYSARVPAEVDVNRNEWLSNNDFGGNNVPDEQAHTSYTIYTNLTSSPNERKAL